MVRYQEIRSSERLRPWVNTFWILEQDGDGRAQQRIVPEGHSELILNWDQPFEFLHEGQWHGQSRCFFAGQIDRPLLLRSQGRVKMLGVAFRPDGAARIFAEPMQRLSGFFTPVDDLSTKLSRRLEHTLEAHDPIKDLEAALLSAAETSRESDQLISEAIRRISESPDIARLARALGLSTRQFERRFNSAVGLPPKVFSRIQRFTKVLRALGEPSCDWVEVAYRCGYYDQAHLIRDCKSFSGATPGILLAKETDLARHFYERFAMSRSPNAKHVSLV